MEIGFALTQHCNLRCPHCIRDDVTTVQSLSPELIASILGQSRALFGCKLGELHRRRASPAPRVRACRRPAGRARPSVPLRQQWLAPHARPEAPRSSCALRRAPESLRRDRRGARRRARTRELSPRAARLRRADEPRIPTHMSLVIDARTRPQLRDAADLAESIGAHELHYILPQPVAASVMRDSDLALEEWDDVRDEIDALAAEGRTHVRIVRDYGFPFDGAERPCTTKARTRLFVDAWGRLVELLPAQRLRLQRCRGRDGPERHSTRRGTARILPARRPVDRGERSTIRRARRTVPLHAMRARERKARLARRPRAEPMGPRGRSANSPTHQPIH